MQEIELTIPPHAPGSAVSGLKPAGKARQTRRAEQEQAQGPATPCAPESARPDQSQPVKAKPVPPETLTQKGAMALAKRLDKYWRDQGYETAHFWVEVIEERFEKIGSYEIYRVASNLVNGWPPRYSDKRSRD